MPSDSAKLRSALKRYGFAVALTIPSTLAVAALAPRLRHYTPTLVGFIPQLVGTWYGGLGPGVVSSLLATAGFAAFSLPRTEGATTASQFVLFLMAYVLEGVVTSTITARFRSSWLSAKESARRNQAIYELSAVLGVATTTTEVCEAILREGLVAFEADTAAVFFLTASGDSLCLAAHVGLDPHVLPLAQPPSEIPVDGETPVALAARHRRVIAAADKEDLRAQFPSLDEVLMKWLPPSNLCAPLMAGDRVLGALAVAFRRPRRFSTEDEHWAGVLAQDAGMALDRVRLLEAEERARFDAQQANRTKDDLVSGVSRALRAPLNAIAVGMRQLDRQPRGRAPNPGTLAVLSRAAGTESDLIDRLIDLLRFAAGQLHLERTRLDLANIVRACTEELGAEAADRGVALSMGLRVKASVDGDGHRLHGVLCQLVRNAIQSTPHGGRAWVDMELRDDRVLVHVIDTGVGIAAAELPRILEPFRHVGASPREPHLGIGLATAQYVASAHGGTLRVESPGQDRGTTSTLELPIAEST